MITLEVIISHADRKKKDEMTRSPDLSETDPKHTISPLLNPHFSPYSVSVLSRFRTDWSSLWLVQSIDPMTHGLVWYYQGHFDSHNLVL